VNAAITTSEASSFRQRRAFLRLPWSIYKGDPNWVPPLLMQVKSTLNTRKNPFYRHARIKLFLARKNGRPAGRVAAIVNDVHNHFHREKAGFLGFFECINDPAVAASLLAVARDWLAGQGMQILRGPASPSTNHECALLVDGFDSPPQIMMPYNPPYYIALLESFGLRKVKDILAYRLDAAKLSPRVYKLSDFLAARARIEVRPVEPRNFARDIAIIRDIYNRAWERNWGFVPVDDEEFNALAREMKSFYEPSLALIAFANGLPAGFSLTLPNLNEALARINGRLFPFGIFTLMRQSRRIASGRNLLLGIVPEFRKLGLDILLYRKTVEAAIALGYTYGELSWILEDNIDMRKVLEKLGARVYKTYRFFEMPIAAPPPAAR